MIYSDSDEVKQILMQELLDLGKGPNQFQLAEQLGEANEYRQFYGLLCEYTHPSGYLLFANPSLVYDPAIALEIARRARYYLYRIVQAYNYIRDNGLC